MPTVSLLEVRQGLVSTSVRRYLTVLALLAPALSAPAVRAGDDAFVPLAIAPGHAGAATAAPIYNGRPATDFPAVVAVGVLNRGGTAVLCSGTLITPTIVLTAGHCLSFGPIAAGIAVFPDGVTEVDYDAIQAAVHPDFNLASAAVADVGVLVLAKPVADVTPMPLASATPPLKTRGTIVGFGDDQHGRAGVKLEGTVKLRRCPRAIRKAGIVRGQLDGSLCWRPKHRGQDTCHGDSGGPLVVDGAVAGVTSGGFPECPGRVSWDTNVAMYRDWIEEKIAQAAEPAS